jgi:glycosyltransferase involved in cell wall biosynthesis
VRIGLNLLYLIPKVVGGTETYARGLLQGLAAVDEQNDYIVYVNQTARAWPLPENANFRRVVCPVDGAVRGFRYGYEQLELPRQVRRDGVDVLHSLAYVAPARLRCESVLTVHDLTFRALPTPMARRLAMEWFVARSVRTATRVIAVSDFTRRAILDAFPVQPERVIVIYEAANRPAVNDNAMAAAPYIVAFGNRFPHKNIHRLLQAFSRLREKGLPHRLQIIGQLPEGVTLDALNGCSADIDVRGYLEPAELDRVLCDAAVLAFPSLYEGFGLPVLEAMAHGVPVVCSNRGALPEIGGDAVCYCDPERVESITESLHVVLTNAGLAADLGRRGARRAQRFSWVKTATETLAVYRDAIASTQA